MAEQRIRNLTAMFYSAPDLPRLYVSDAFTAELIDQAPVWPFDAGAVDYDLVYIIVAGFCGLDGIDLTAGDVVHVPAGSVRNFTGVSRRFSMWKLTLDPKRPPEDSIPHLPPRLASQS